jgi:hypothetical protein
VGVRAEGPPEVVRGGGLKCIWRVPLNT